MTSLTVGTVGGLQTVTYDVLYGVDLSGAQVTHGGAAVFAPSAAALERWALEGVAPGLSQQARSALL
eukprot:9340968-Alexandrium_andersonii.AAC.1